MLSLKYRLAGAFLVLLLVATASCASGPNASDEGGGPDPATRTSQPADEHSDREGDVSPDQGTEGRLEYIEPASAADECGVFQGLLDLNEQAASQTAEASAAQLEERLRLISDSAARLSELAEAESERERWDAMSADYLDAADLLGASGGQIANDSFLALLAAAVQSSNVAYAEQEPQAESECGISLAPLQGE